MHIENQEAIPGRGYKFDQLKYLMANGITCHGLACSYHLVTRGEASVIGKTFAHGIQLQNLIQQI